MLLAIDAGNTNIVFAVHDGKEIRAEWRAVTETTRTADEYAVLLKQLLQLAGLNFADLDAAIIATVVPAALFDLRQFCRRYLKCEPLVIGDPDVDLGIEVQCRPARARWAPTGSSTRWRRMSATRAPSIVVDFGTATTFDIVSEKGDYEGGVIAPGVNLSAEALHQAAAMLPRVAVQRTQKRDRQGHRARDAVGPFWGYIGLIEGLVARIKEEYGKPMTVMATGGLANPVPAPDARRSINSIPISRSAA